MTHTLHYKISIVGALISSIAFTALAVFAIAPGETLDPVGDSNITCSGPTDITCIINPYDGLGINRILYLNGSGDITTDDNFLRDENSFYIAGEMGIDEIGEFMIGDYTSGFGTFPGIGFKYEYDTNIISSIGILNAGSSNEGIIGIIAEDLNSEMRHYLNMDPGFGITIESRDSQLNRRSTFRSQPDVIDIFHLNGNTANRIGVDGAGITFQQIPDINDLNITTGYTFPMVDGAAGEVLATDGNGILSWEDPSMLVSDENLKTDIKNINDSVLSQIHNIRTVTYVAKNDPNQRTQIGFLAQNLEQYFPELVGERNDGYKGVYYAQMTPILTKAIQEMDLKISILEQQVISSGGFSLSTIRSLIQNILSDIENGIQNIFAKRITTEELCVEDVCVTRDQFLQMIENSNSSFDQNPIEEEPIVEENNETDLLEDEEIEVIVHENETNQDEEIIVDEESTELEQELQEEEIQNNSEENPSDAVEEETPGTPQE